MLPKIVITVTTMTILMIAMASIGLATDQDMSQDQMMQKYMEAAKVGPNHELLANMAGTWTATVKAWQDPSQPPEVTTGKSVAKLIMDGRFLQTDYEGMMMGMAMHGFGLLGYDNVNQEYCGLWLDNMSTGMMPYTGQFDKKTQTLTCHGEYTDAMTGMQVTTRMVTTVIDENKHTWEMSSPGPDGQEVRWVEITYQR